MTRLGARIGVLRTAARLSQRDVGRALNVDPSTVARWETGETRLYAHLLPRLAQVMEIDPCNFFSEGPVLPAPKQSALDRGTDYLARELTRSLLDLPDEEFGRVMKRALSEGERW